MTDCMMSNGSFRLKISFNFCEMDEKRDQDSLRRISFFYIFRKIFENLESSWFARKCNKLYVFSSQQRYRGRKALAYEPGCFS